MSTGEKQRKKAEKSLRDQLQLKASGDKPSPTGGENHKHRAAWSTFEQIQYDPSTSSKVVAEWVKDDNYQAMTEALQNAMRLIERGQTAITPEDLERALRGGVSVQAEPAGPFFEVAFDEYLKTKDVKASTLQNYKDTGTIFQRFVGRKHVHKITGLDLQAFIDDQKKQGRSQRTRQKHLNCLRSFFSWARDVAKYAKEDPTAGIKVRVLRSQRKKKRKGLAVDEAKKLLAACHVKRKQQRQDIQHVWLATFIALRTGLRKANILGLRWSQVDLERGTIHVAADQYKTDRAEDLEIPIHWELWRVLRLWKRLREDSPKATQQNLVIGKRSKDIKVPFDAATKRAGVDTDFHNLRHAFKTWLVEADVPKPVHDALTGHSPGSVSDSYVHPTMQKMRECVNRLPPLLGRNRDHRKQGNESG